MAPRNRKVAGFRCGFLLDRWYGFSTSYGVRGNISPQSDGGGPPARQRWTSAASSHPPCSKSRCTPNRPSRLWRAQPRHYSENEKWGGEGGGGVVCFNLPPICFIFFSNCASWGEAAIATRFDARFSFASNLYLFQVCFKPLRPTLEIHLQSASNPPQNVSTSSTSNPWKKRRGDRVLSLAR